MRRALLLSGSLGAGHDVAARAFAASLAGRGWSTDVLDAMALLGKGGGSAGEAVFRGMLAVPGLYDAFHFAGLRAGSRVALLADAAARRQLVPRLRDYLDAHPADLVVSVFATAASAVSFLADRYPGMSHVVLCSDVTPHRLWVHPNVDLYLVTSAPAEAAVRRYQPRARIRVVQPPVRPGFYDPPTQERARADLGLPVEDRAVLLMSGAWGLGPIAQALAYISWPARRIGGGGGVPRHAGHAGAVRRVPLRRATPGQPTGAARRRRSAAATGAEAARLPRR